MKEIDERRHDESVREERREGSSTATHDGSTGPLEDFLHAAERALGLPEPSPNRWHRAGVTARTERWIDIGSRFVALLLVAGWSWSIYLTATGRQDPSAPGAVSTIAAALTNADAPSTAYLTDAALTALTG
jgi:hypothetical protein